MKKWLLCLWAFLVGLAADAGAAGSPLDRIYTPMPLTRTGTSDTLLFSDSPEYVFQPGILAEGVIQGRGRIYYYHVNEMKKDAVLAVYGESSHAELIHIKRTVFGDPSRDYVTSGQTLSFREVTQIDGPGEDKVLIPGRRTVLVKDPADPVSFGNLITGYVEIETKNPVRIGVAMLPAEEPLQETLKTAKPAAADTQGMRGTFPLNLSFRNSTVWNTDTDGPKEIIIGDGKTDPFLKGTDEMDRVIRENTGNYGVNYDITIQTNGTRDYDLYLNSMGGIFLATFMVYQDGLPRIYRTDVKHWFGDSTDRDYIQAGTWRAGRDVVIRIIPPGAAFLPVRFLLVPRLQQGGTAHIPTDQGGK